LNKKESNLVHYKWIAIKLKENNYNKKKVYNLFNNFKRDTQSNCEQDSYKRVVRNVYVQLMKNKREGKEEINPPSRHIEYPSLFPLNEKEKIKQGEGELEKRKGKIRKVKLEKEILIEFLKEAIMRDKRKLDYSDLERIAKSNNFQAELFHVIIPNLNEVLTSIYKMNLLHVEEDMRYEKLKNKQLETRKELNYYKSKNVSMDSFIDILKEAVEEYIPIDKIPRVNPIPINPNREALVTLCDIHWAEVVDKKEMMGLNEYNIEIAKKRIDKLFSAVIGNALELNIDTINLALLGDMITGIIHEEVIRNAEVPTVESVLTVGDYLSQHIQNLSKHFSEINLYCVCGNHGRILPGKPYFKKYSDYNFDTLIFETMQRQLKNITNKFVIAKSPFLIAEILDQKVFMTHGHIFGGGGNGYQPIPNNISKNMAKLSSLMDKIGYPVDFALCGHWHTETQTLSFDMIPVHVSGSIVGGDEYALGKLCRSNEPSQLFFCIEKGTGIKYKNVVYL